MSRPLVLALAVLGVAACGPPREADTAEGRGSRDAEQAEDLGLDADTFAALAFPDTAGKPFVLVSDLPQPQVLLEDAADHFTVFDGVHRRRYEKTLPAPDSDAPLPAHFDRLDDEQLVSRSTSFRYDPRRLLFLAAVLQRKGASRAAQQLVQPVVRTRRELRQLVREVAAARFVNEATTRYAAGGAREDYERELAQAIAFEGTETAREAQSRLTSSRTAKPPPPPPRSALDTLIEARIDALAEERCAHGSPWSGRLEGAAARIVALGLSAEPALARIKADPRPSRCVTGDGYPESATGGICEIDPAACPSPDRPHLEGLVPVGELARRAHAVLTRDLGAPSEPSAVGDLECDPSHGHDEEAEQLVSSALDAGDVAAALAITTSATGRLRVQMIGRLARSTDARVMAFLLGEATSSLVFGARVRAAEALRAHGDSRWARLTGDTIDAAMRTAHPREERCDRDLVLDRWRAVLQADSAAALAALAPVAAGFALYGPRAKLDIVQPVLRAVFVEPLPPGAAGTRAQPQLRAEEARSIIALALADTRPIPIEMSFTVGPPTKVRPRVLAGRTVVCRQPSPSDIAAVFVGERIHVPYACGDSPGDKADAVKRMLSLRGKPAGW